MTREGRSEATTLLDVAKIEGLAILILFFAIAANCGTDARALSKAVALNFGGEPGIGELDAVIVYQ